MLVAQLQIMKNHNNRYKLADIQKDPEFTILEYLMYIQE